MGRIVIPCGRGRVGKTLLAQAIAEALSRQGERVTAWDCDRVPGLRKRILARHPAGSSPSARRAAIEDAIQEVYAGEACDTAVIDVGGDDLVWHDILAKAPSLTEALDDAGVTTVAVHVLGPNADKDLAYYRGVWNTDAYSTQLVALNHGLVPADVDADDAFAGVRKVLNGIRPLVVRALPPEVIEAIETAAKGQTLDELATDLRKKNVVNELSLRSWLNVSIKPLIEAIQNDAVDPPRAA